MIFFLVYFFELSWVEKELKVTIIEEEIEGLGHFLVTLLWQLNGIEWIKWKMLQDCVPSVSPHFFYYFIMSSVNNFFFNLDWNLFVEMQGASFGCLKKPCCLDLSPLIVFISVILSLYETAKYDVKKNGGVLSEVNRIKFTREIKSMLESAFVAGFYACSVIKRQTFSKTFCSHCFLISGMECITWKISQEHLISFTASSWVQ